MMLFLALWAVCVLVSVQAECPNACSSHGRCGAYDACQCYRNWGGNDCSERICQFGNAHVDTPKGDLDASGGQLTDPSTLVVVGDNIFPKGTYEQYPRMEDSDGNQLTNTAHAYSECSNKGICDRSSGTCDCFEGYEGSACQRASCPMSSNGVCSGHGTCKTIGELASDNNDNVYRLWDEDKTMGCDCDAGYSGADCSNRVCKYGADPLYYDDFANVRFANFTMQFYMQPSAASSSYTMAYGNYSIIFTDVYGEDWETDPIDINAGCGVIQDRLESLPNDVIPTGSVLCYRSEEAQHTSNTDTNTGQVVSSSVDETVVSRTSDLAGVFAAENGMIYDKTMQIIARYIIAFPGNPGEIATPKINKYLDGSRPTLFTTETGTSTLGWHVFPNGFTGESTDYVNDECEGVLVGIKEDYTHFQNYLTFDSTEAQKRLKECLGDSNGITTDNVEVYDWDWGTYSNPHLIKLVDATQDEYVEYLRADGSSYKVLQTDSNNDYVNTADLLYPVSLLCNNGKEWVYATSGSTTLNRFSGDGTHSTTLADGAFLGDFGFCKALNPPGFYAIMYYDDCTGDSSWVGSGQAWALGGGTADTDICDATNPWRVITAVNRGEDSSSDVSETFSADTKFHVFTTKGTMQQVSQYAQIYTSNDLMSDEARLASYHSNVIHAANTTRDLADSSPSPFSNNGQMDCETMESMIGPGDGSTYGTSVGALDCLNYGDKVFFLNLGTWDSTSCQATNTYRGAQYTSSNSLSCKYTPTAISYGTNPQFVNMYTVKKISFEPASYDTADNAAQVDESIQGDGNGLDTEIASTWESYRRQIVLDYGVNANYQLVQGGPYSTNADSTTEDGKTDSKSQSGNDDNLVDSGATVYKFYPPTLAKTQSTGYNYVAECSNRGICDGETGLCDCFAGYSGDNCGSVSSLVQ